jgi:hypothetical protein
VKHFDRLCQRAQSLAESAGDETIEPRAMALIDTEDDLKYRKKYAKNWRQ